MPSRSTIAIKSNPVLWSRVKTQVMRGSKGGPPGKWSARKSQLAVRLYKSRGGRYKGKKSPHNSLTKWSREKWGYVSPKNAKSRRGRYLPLAVRRHMSASARRSENRRKGSKRGKWVPYGGEVRRLMRKHRIVRSRRGTRVKRSH
jgi:hypothetical protein